MTSVSSLPPAALQGSIATLSSALAENGVTNGSSDSSKNSPASESANGNGLEDGEIQEVDMESQAEGIRTVFTDPTNFNVKVCTLVSGDPFIRTKQIINAWHRIHLSL